MKELANPISPLSLILVLGLSSALGCGAAKQSDARAVAGEAAPAPAEAMGGDMAADDGDDEPMQLVAAADKIVAASKKTLAKPAERGTQREFPAPDYQAEYDGPRVDFRETVHWSPSVVTDSSGNAEVSFYLSDAITSFRATAEGLSADGTPGHGVTAFSSALPLSIAAKLPLEVMRGDRLRVPVTVHNRSDEGTSVKLTTRLGKSLALRRSAPRSLWVPKGSERTVLLDVNVVGGGTGAKASAAMIELGVKNRFAKDTLRRDLKVALPGYPREKAYSGTLTGNKIHRVDVPRAIVPGSLSATVQFYPSPVSSMIAGTEAIIREPSGCFEQASSANYPNVMALAYMKEHNALDTKLVAKTKTTLNNGYKKLTGYESSGSGFEWFGGNPGHEALTAYGLMQFTEMTEIYPSVDRQMIARTRNWLKSRRDGKGGYKLNARALDSFGRASQDVTDAYITFALTEAGSTTMKSELSREIARAESMTSERDPYILALATNTLLNVGSKSGASAAATLAGLQKKDGRFSGADHSITRSGGVALEIETTALAAMALLKSGQHGKSASKALAWIATQRSGGGQFGSTQSTILALKALTAQASASSRLEPGSFATLVVNGKRVKRLSLEGDGNAPIRFDNLGPFLRAGSNTVELQAPSGARLDYSLGVAYRETRPTSSSKSKVGVSTRLGRRTARVGKSIVMSTEVRNRTAEGLPMVIARVGIPGGLSYQRWQLDELVTQKVIDFYETREREVVLYFRQMKPSEVKTVTLQLLAAVPGSFSSPPTAAYLYYTDEHRDYAKPVRISIKRPGRRVKATAAKEKNHVAK